MARFKDALITCAQITGGDDPDYIQRIMAHFKPIAVNDSGEPLYSIPQMMAAMIRGEPKKRHKSEENTDEQ